MAVMLNEGKSCADKAGREINCTLKIDVSDAINTYGYRAGVGTALLCHG